MHANVQSSPTKKQRHNQGMHDKNKCTQVKQTLQHVIGIHQCQKNIEI